MSAPDQAAPGEGGGEFSRLVPLAGLPRAGRALALEASAAECRALAERFAIPAIAAFTAELRLLPRADGSVRVTGRLAARVTQTCVVSLEPFAQALEAPVDLVFVPAELEEARGAAAPMDADAPDEIVFDGSAIELGEALAQSLSLALDPWPRNPASVLPVLPPDAEGDGEDEQGPAPAAGPAGRDNPFAVLARRRR